MNLFVCMCCCVGLAWLTAADVNGWMIANGVTAGTRTLYKWSLTCTKHIQTVKYLPVYVQYKNLSDRRRKKENLAAKEICNFSQVGRKFSEYTLYSKQNNTQKFNRKRKCKRVKNEDKHIFSLYRNIPKNVLRNKSHKIFPTCYDKILMHTQVEKYFTYIRVPE